MKFPKTNWTWCLDTDASGKALVAVLQQRSPDGKMHVIAYASRSLKEQEAKWLIWELEAFGITWGILHFAEYLRCLPCFTVRTDHESLRWLWKSENKRIARWALALQEYSFEVHYQKGKQHTHVDLFTRDVQLSELDHLLTDRILTTAHVFQITWDREAPSADNAVFPSVEEVTRAQKEENTESMALLSRNGLLTTKEGQIYSTYHRKCENKYYIFTNLVARVDTKE